MGLHGVAWGEVVVGHGQCWMLARIQLASCGRGKDEAAEPLPQSVWLIEASREHRVVPPVATLDTTCVSCYQ